LVFGLTEDLLPENERYWELTNYRPRVSFDAAARAALEGEHEHAATTGPIGLFEEALVRRTGLRSRPHEKRAP